MQLKHITIIFYILLIEIKLFNNKKLNYLQNQYF